MNFKEFEYQLWQDYISKIEGSAVLEYYGGSLQTDGTYLLSDNKHYKVKSVATGSDLLEKQGFFNETMNIIDFITMKLKDKHGLKYLLHKQELFNGEASAVWNFRWGETISNRWWNQRPLRRSEMKNLLAYIKTMDNPMDCFSGEVGKLSRIFKPYVQLWAQNEHVLDDFATRKGISLDDPNFQRLKESICDPYESQFADLIQTAIDQSQNMDVEKLPKGVKELTLDIANQKEVMASLAKIPAINTFLANADRNYDLSFTLLTPYHVDKYPGEAVSIKALLDEIGQKDLSLYAEEYGITDKVAAIKLSYPVYIKETGERITTTDISCAFTPSILLSTSGGGQPSQIKDIKTWHKLPEKIPMIALPSIHRENELRKWTTPQEKKLYAGIKTKPFEFRKSADSTERSKLMYQQLKLVDITEIKGGLELEDILKGIGYVKHGFDGVNVRFLPPTDTSLPLLVQDMPDSVKDENTGRIYYKETFIEAHKEQICQHFGIEKLFDRFKDDAILYLCSEKSGKHQQTRLRQALSYSWDLTKNKFGSVLLQMQDPASTKVYVKYDPKTMTLKSGLLNYSVTTNDVLQVIHENNPFIALMNKYKAQIESERPELAPVVEADSGKKYRILSGEAHTQEIYNDANEKIQLHRIQALRDITDNDGHILVKAGDLGGFIENESNLNQEDETWLYASDNAITENVDNNRSLLSL